MIKLLLILSFFLFADKFDDALQTSKQAFTKSNSHIQQRVVKVKQPVQSRPLHTEVALPKVKRAVKVQKVRLKKSTQRLIEKDSYYKQLAFEMLLNKIDGTQTELEKIEKIVFQNAKVLNLQSDVDGIQKKRHEDIKFYVNLLIVFLTTFLGFYGTKHGVRKYKANKEKRGA